MFFSNSMIKLQSLEQDPVLRKELCETAKELILTKHYLRFKDSMRTVAIAKEYKGINIILEKEEMDDFEPSMVLNFRNIAYEIPIYLLTMGSLLESRNFDSSDQEMEFNSDRKRSRLLLLEQ